ncbi:MAG: Glycosyltransferase [Candidatus Beckwithbacteria bacterium GW2011_GWA2_43_10]|uniref:Glycosyltransferase n=1 Tax=Candidatus Beckwithbacteria bacterium GW2011_GWA2_43_10 TaxID=1618369 RepID=A0A0G1F040_9BACT|nr:MAG: Glycosyltransferase [Candidatus Beckwithbacteria bacterium GW2011_GWA2_43_10]
MKEVHTSEVNISVIIPCKSKADLCPELLAALKKQSVKPLEVLIITDKLCPDDPATKRDWGAKKSVGSVLAFIDSDAYPDKHWLKNALIQFNNPNVAAVCGPGLTPPSDSTRQKISGLVWSTKIGAGPYTYRSRQEKSCFVDDYPSFNFLVKKKDFLAVSGFDTQFWPGEDTKLCHDLVYQLKKQILYSPQVIVYHHRRPIWLPHLQQISRYGFQRGRFVRLFPKTSRRFSYFLPLLLPLIFPLYFLALIITAVYYRSLFLAPVIFLTHLVYALYFLKGLLYQP